MRTPYRNGYNDGLAFARRDIMIDRQPRTTAEIRKYAASKYGSANNDGMNLKRRGFCDGYIAGIDGYNIEREAHYGFVSEER